MKCLEEAIILLEAVADKDTRWITIGDEDNPHRVLINGKTGEILGGGIPKSLHGKNISDVNNHFKNTNTAGKSKSKFPTSGPKAWSSVDVTMEFPTAAQARKFVYKDFDMAEHKIRTSQNEKLKNLYGRISNKNAKTFDYVGQEPEKIGKGKTAKYVFKKHFEGTKEDLEQYLSLFKFDWNVSEITNVKHEPKELTHVHKNFDGLSKGDDNTAIIQQLETAGIEVEETAKGFDLKGSKDILRKYLKSYGYDEREFKLKEIDNKKSDTKDIVKKSKPTHKVNIDVTFDGNDNEDNLVKALDKAGIKYDLKLSNNADYEVELKADKDTLIKYLEKNGYDDYVDWIEDNN